MGAVLGKFATSLSYSETLKKLVSRKRKSSEDASDGEDNYDLEKRLHITKKKRLRKKLLSTPQYIYQALFVEGLDSDITLMALNKQWKLHKVYLCQSPYFASMFSGSWKESNENIINIEIVDPKITVTSLHIVLGSLYFNELELELGNLVPVLATAALFQLDSLLERCAEVMTETLHMEVVIEYYNAAVEYGVGSLKNAAFNWLLANLLTYIRHIPQLLSSISVELMSKLVRSPNLFVIQTESSIYFMLQTWLYHKVSCREPGGGSKDQILEESSKYFQARYRNVEFLETEEGKLYAEPFRGLRFQYVIHLLEDMNRITSDHIVPLAWIHEAMTSTWTSLLRLDHGLDRGPRECTEEELTIRGLRCGRVLPDAGEHVWRWTGFYHGLDLVWTCHNLCIRVRRNHRGNDVGSMLSMAKRRNIICRITIAKLNQQRQTEYCEVSAVQCLSLLRHEEMTVMNLKKDVVFPVYLLGEMLLSSAE